MHSLLLLSDACDADVVLVLVCAVQGADDMPTFNVSYKPQKISPKFEGTVRQLLHKKIRDSYLHPQVGPSPGCICPKHALQCVQHNIGWLFCVVWQLVFRNADWQHY
jgi:hypothetical protein